MSASSPSQRTCPTCGAVYGADVIFCRNDGTILDQSAGSLTGKIIADRYRIIARIGEGGMGQVYLAEHVHMKRKCAIKFLNPDLAGNEGAVKRFYREAENASRIDHPSVVTVYDFGQTTDGGIYLAMEYVEGESLQKRVERDSAMPVDLIASIVRQTASALGAAHAMGIVHRDLKPDNIMLLERDGDIRVKVVDFGIAKARGAEQKVTMTGAIVGTPDYMSPEQLLSGEVDGGADQYALALVAVKMLTGKLPFAATTSIESMTSRLTTAPMPLRALRAEVAWPQPLQDVIARALATEPAQRYASITDFSRAFDKTIGGISAAVAKTVTELHLDQSIIPPTRVSPSPNALPARRWPVAAAAIVILVAGGSAGLWLAGKDRVPGLDTASPATPPPQVAAADSTTIQLQANLDPPPAVASSAPAAGGQGAELLSRESRQAVPRNDPPADSTPAVPPAVRAPARTTADKDTLRPIAAPAAGATKQIQRPPADTPVQRDTAAPTDTAGLLLGPRQVQAAYTMLRGVVTPDAPAEALVRVKRRIDLLLPRMAERTDSVRFFGLRAQSQAFSGDIPGACASLDTAATLAKSTSLEAALTRAATRLNCSSAAPR